MRLTPYFIFIVVLFLVGCISPDNSTVEGTGTPDIAVCTAIPGVEDGADFVPQSAVVHGIDGRTHPDLFYLAWARLDDRTDLRFPAKGYDDVGFEDKLLVSRRKPDGSGFRTWQIWPPMANDCSDTEKVRIHSFDVAPDGRSLFLSMSREEADNPNRKLGIYRLDIANQTLEKLSKDNTVDFLDPSYVGNDVDSDHEIVMVAKTVRSDEIPANYFDVGFVGSSELKDEYDRDNTPLIHKLDVVTGDTTRIGLNNSHQTQPFVMNDPNNTKIIVFTQWEHQDRTNRFSLWKMQIDGSDNFTFFGEESAIDDASPNIFQGRKVRSGAYKDYVLMTQGARANSNFAAEGHIIMTKRDNLDLRSQRIYLEKLVNTGVDQNISFTPEHYNDESFVYAHRATSDNSHSLYIKDFPANPTDPLIVDNGEEVISGIDYHLVMPRSFYAPTTSKIAPTDGDIGQSRASFTNTNLNGHSGFLVQNIGASDNGVQHQLDGIAVNDLSLQFFLPSHHFNNSQAISTRNGAELSIPVGNPLKPNADGSIGVILKEGLYVWKINKRFDYVTAQGVTSDLWLPVRAERQEVSFVKNRVNACNQCHQERGQANLDLYANYNSSAAAVMKGDLASLKGTDYDLSQVNGYDNIPDFHADIAPLFTQKTNAAGQTCATCHNAYDKLNLSNTSGVSEINPMYRTLVQGAHKLANDVVPFVSQSINPLGMDNNYMPAPFFWSLLLDDDLSVSSDASHANASSRNLERAGDYGAKFDQDVADDIADINTNKHNHLGHWSVADMQKFITYTTTQTAVGLSNEITFTKNAIDRGDAVAQKAYQSLRRNCFGCHNNHQTEGVDDVSFGLPIEKRFTSNTLLKDTQTRFVVKSHVANKLDTQYSSLLSKSNLTSSMNSTLLSASYRIDFNAFDDSELLVYARSDNQLNATVNHSGFTGLDVNTTDYQVIENWVKGVIGAVNNAPTIDSAVQNTITIREYDDPIFQGQPITWSDSDDVGGSELSQLFIKPSGISTHTVNDTMLALTYDSFTSARLKTYAILGDRGVQDLEFTMSDGQPWSTSEKLTVTIESDYVVPPPSSTLPSARAFYTVRASSELRLLDTSGSDVLVGIIRDQNDVTLNITQWTTVYRRSDMGWLYFVNQTEQKIYVVDETTAQLQSIITLDHLPNKETDSHKQTVYLIWWRPAEGNPGDAGYSPGRLEGLLESKLSKTLNGDFHVLLGDAVTLDAATEVSSIPNYQERIVQGSNTLSVYVWRRATFMSKWVINGIDSLSVLNLVTGKSKVMSDFDFPAQTIDGISYPAATYANVRAVVVAEDGAFYGFNQDINAPVEVFNFDPINKTQQVVDTIPSWIQDYLNDPLTYGTPFLIIDPR